MTPETLRELLDQVRTGKLPVESALERMRHLPFEDIGFAKVDHHRALRHGMPEVIFAQGKTPQQVAAIAKCLIKNSKNLLITRADRPTAALVKKQIRKAEYFPLSRAIRVWGDRTIRGKGKIAVVCAGTSDIPVAEEARVTAELMGARVTAAYDAGVAGLHRILARRKELAESDAVVVVAGMEGALASVVGGLVSCPVVACPTSVGYGASFGGVAALLAMLNSCAPGVSVVNIDDGFGAGYVAGLIARRRAAR